MYLRNQLDNGCSYDDMFALRDILTDCLHLAHKLQINIDDRLEDAKEVFYTEKELENE